MRSGKIGELGINAGARASESARAEGPGGGRRGAPAKDGIALPVVIIRIIERMVAP